MKLRIRRVDIVKMNNLDKHLDLGCGDKPRNPFRANDLYGVDIRDVRELKLQDFNYKKANILKEGIPFPDGFFDSVSAFDFLEHVPRVNVESSNGENFPFIKVMNEIYRVLKPGGRFFSLTPVYPHPSVFVDPTHVNFITKNTHEYFVGERPSGAMYGFVGRFKVLGVYKEVPKNVYHMQQPTSRKVLRRISRMVFQGGLSHIVWDLQALK